MQTSLVVMYTMKSFLSFRLALEKKAELYNHLADDAGNSELSDRFLVDFKTKKEEEVKESVKHVPEVEEFEEVEDEIDSNGDDDEWCLIIFLY